MSEVKSGGNPMVRAPEALHPLIREFARVYRLGKGEQVRGALEQALASLSTGVITSVSSHDAATIADILTRLERVENILYSQLHTPDNNNVDSLESNLNIGDSGDTPILYTPSIDNGVLPTLAGRPVNNKPVDPVGRRRTLEATERKQAQFLNQVIQEHLNQIPRNTLGVEHIEVEDSQKLQELQAQLAANQDERDNLSQEIYKVAGGSGAWYERIQELEQELDQLRSLPLDKDDAATRVEAIAEPEAEDAEPEPVAPLVAGPEPEGTAIAEPKASTKQPLREQITKNTRYTQSQLAARFGKFTKKGYPDCSQLSSHKKDLLFIAWSQERDPDQIGWRYDGKRYFYPVL